MRALIGYKPKTFREARLHTAILLILDTGLRISEALHLRHADIDNDNLILKVFGKGQKERLVPFSVELRRRLYRFDQLKAKKGIRSEFVFAGFRDARWEKRNSSTSLETRYGAARRLCQPAKWCRLWVARAGRRNTKR